MTFLRTIPSILRRPALAVAAAALLLAGAGLAAPALAQRPGPDPGPGERPAWGEHGGPGAHRLGRLARVLDLTDAQLAEARALHEAAREDLRPIFEESRELRTRLESLLDAAAPDPTAVGEVVIALRRNRGEMKAIHEQTKAAFEALLTPEQREELATLEEAKEELGPRFRGRRGHRFGGPGRGGPGAPLG